MAFTKKMILSTMLGLSIIQAVHASPTKKNSDMEQDARYFRFKVMAEFEKKCHPIKSISFSAYDACLGNHDKLVELPFLKKLLNNSKDKIFISQDHFVKKCTTHMKDEMPKTNVEGYCKDVYQNFVMAHTEYHRSPNDWAYHLD